MVSLPFVVGSSGKLWLCAGEELAAGGAAGHTVVVEAGPAGDMGLVEEARGTTRQGQAGDMAAAAAVGSEDVGGPCQVEALGEVEGAE